MIDLSADIFYLNAPHTLSNRSLPPPTGKGEEKQGLYLYYITESHLLNLFFCPG